MFLLVPVPSNTFSKKGTDFAFAFLGYDRVPKHSKKFGTGISVLLQKSDLLSIYFPTSYVEGATLACSIFRSVLAFSFPFCSQSCGAALTLKRRSVEKGTERHSKRPTLWRRSFTTAKLHRTENGTEWLYFVFSSGLNLAIPNLCPSSYLQRAEEEPSAGATLPERVVAFEAVRRPGRCTEPSTSHTAGPAATFGRPESYAKRRNYCV